MGSCAPLIEEAKSNRQHRFRGNCLQASYNKFFYSCDENAGCLSKTADLNGCAPRSSDGNCFLVNTNSLGVRKPPPFSEVPQS